MDVSATTAPRSDQMNAEDLLSGPRTFTVTEVRVIGGDQPVHVFLAEFPSDRPYKPNLTARRVLSKLWGSESEGWIGKRLTLFRDPEVKFGRDTPGGIKVSHASGIEGRQTLWLTVTKGKRAPYIVDPLPDEPAALTAPMIASATDIDQLREWHRQHPGQRAAIQARVAEIRAAGDGS